MPPELKPRIFYYKRCRFLDSEGGDSLATLLTAALGTRGTAASRMQPAPQQDGTLRLVNDFLIHERGCFGDLVEWTQGQAQQIISIDKERRSLEVSLLTPAEQQEFIEGMAYFYAYGNHVIFSKGRGVGHGSLEHHLTWLLRDCAQVMPGGASLMLLDTPGRDVGTQEQLAKVKRIQLTPAAINEPRKRTATTGSKEKFDLRRDILEALVERMRHTSALRMSEPKLQQLMANRNLQASLTLSVRGTPDADSVQLLDVLAQALRGSDSDVGFAIDIPGVGKFHGDVLTLKTSELVPHTEGRPDARAMATQMRQWLLQLIAQHEVPGEV